MNARRAAFARLAACLALAAAVTAAERPALVTVATSEDQAVEGGSWRHLLKRTQRPWECVARDRPASCVENSVVIDNQSPLTLECRLQLDYAAADGLRITDADVPALVLPRSSREVRGRVTASDTTASVRAAECRARAPYKRLPKTPGCEYEMYGEPLESYYPAAAAQRALEGPVVLSFVLPKARGAATEATVAESSLVPELDAAALRFLADQRFNTKCPGTRYDLRMRFALRDQIARVP